MMRCFDFSPAAVNLGLSLKFARLQRSSKAKATRNAIGIEACIRLRPPKPIGGTVMRRGGLEVVPGIIRPRWFPEVSVE